MFYKNRIWGKTIKAILGISALVTVSGGLVSCDIGGDEDGEEIEEQRGENEDDVDILPDVNVQGFPNLTI